MGLLIWLKPGEEIMLNGARIENPHAHKIRLQLNNHARLLRARDRFELPSAPSSGERIYHEAMLLSGGDPAGSMGRLRDALEVGETAATATTDREDRALILERVRDHAREGRFYEAMVAARGLIALERADHPLLRRED